MLFVSCVELHRRYPAIGVQFVHTRWPVLRKALLHSCVSFGRLLISDLLAQSPLDSTRAGSLCCTYATYSHLSLILAGNRPG